MKKKFYDYILLGVLLFVAIPIRANIWLINDSLKSIYVGAPPNTARNLGVNMRQINGIYWRYGDRFLQLDLAATHVRLAGTNDTISFCTYGTTFSYCDVTASNSYIMSDIVRKERVNLLPSGLKEIVQIKPLLFSIGEDAKNQILQQNIVKTGNSDCLNFEITSLSKVIPEAVVNLGEGQKGINYTAIIPFLTKAIQELKTTVENQEIEVDSLKKLLDGKSISYSTSISTQEKNESYKVVSYNIPENATEASMQLCNETGKQIRMINILGTKNTIIKSDELSSKSGYYSIIIDGNLISTGKLIF